MEAHEAMERFERAEEATEAREQFARHAALLVAILAALLAIAALSANKATEDAILNQARSTDKFNELEANSLKKHINDTTAKSLTIQTKGTPNASAAKKTAAELEAKVASKYGPNEARLQPEAEHFAKRSERDEKHHRTFQFAEAALQIGIVLASVAIIARAGMLVFASIGVGLFGIFFLVDGFLLFWKI
jgi:hypothetical protein